MNHKTSSQQYVLCVNNEKYPASLELHKIYRCIPDKEAQAHKLLRIIDESGEDYLYPKDYFIPIRVPAKALRAFSRTRSAILKTSPSEPKRPRHSLRGKKIVHGSF